MFAIALFVAVEVSVQTHKVTLDNISKVCYTDGNIVAVNLNDDSANIVNLDTTGTGLGQISYSLTSGNTYKYVSQIFTYNGNTYAHVLGLNSTNGLVQSDSVALCNFSGESLDTKWSIPYTGDIFESVALYTTIIDDNLYYITLEDSIATLNCINALGVDSVVYSTELPTTDFSQWYITSDLKMVGCSSYLGVYILDSTSASKVYPLTDDVSSLVDFSLYDNVLYFTDLNNNQSITYSVDTQDIKYFEKTTYSSVETTSLKDLQYIGDDTYIAVCESAKNSDKIAICSSGNTNFLEDVTYSFSANSTFVKNLVVLFVALVVVALVIYMCIISEKRILIGFKVMVIFIVAFVVAIPVIAYNIKSNLEENLLTGRYNTAYIDIANIIHDYYLDYLSEDLADFQQPDEWLYATLEDAFYSDENIIDIQDRNSRSDNIIKPVYYAFHILNSDGTLVTLKTSTSYENLPTEYLYNNSIVESYLETLDTGMPLRATVSSDKGDCYVLAYPEGNLLIEVGFEKYIIDNQIDSHMSNFKYIVGAILGAMFVVFVVLLMLSLRPIRVLLRRLKSDYFKKHNRISKRVATNEIVEINDVFEGMMININKSQLEMENNNQAYSQFAPSEILYMIYGNNDILQSKANDSKQKMLYIMQINLSQLPKDTFNTSLDTIIKTLKQHNGIIEYFNLDYINVFFEDAPKAVLETSVELLQTLNDTISIALSYGVAIPSVLGANNRLEALVVSRQKKVTERLIDISKKFELKLLVSENFYEKVSSLQNFELCLIGNIKVDGEYIKVYDVLNATGQADELSDVRKDFESGVQFFLNQDFLSAKKSFVNVLRYNSNNAMAKEYLTMCETYITNSNNVNTDIL
jgi:hypothetical protein